MEDIPRQQVFMAARAPQIREALRRVAAHTRNDLRVTRQRDLRFLIDFLIRFPRSTSGDDRRARGQGDPLAPASAGAGTSHDCSTIWRASTRWDAAYSLPSDSAICHLGTVEDIVDEGQRMGHCVASYVPEAIAGRCYLFHVDHEGDAATVMVQWDGAITEAAGPRNRRNEALPWGVGQLRQWARWLQLAETRRAG